MENLAFNDGQSFFDYQCHYGDTDIQPKKGVVAIVLDARKEFGVSEAVKIKPDGTQLASIRVAAPDGGFKTMAETPTAGSGMKLSPGDVVIWVPVERNTKNPMAVLDDRAEWYGFIVAIVKPELNISNGRFEVIEQYA